MNTIHRWFSNKGSSIRRLAVFHILFFLSLRGFAQEGFDFLMTRRLPDCLDIAYNCTYMYEDYMRRDNRDSAHKLLEYWKARCPGQEMLQRSRILYALKYHAYSDSCLDDDILSSIDRFRTIAKYINAHSPSEDVSEFRPFDDYTLSLASSLVNDYEPGTIEHLLCRFYSGHVDSIYAEAQKPQYASSKIHKLLQQRLNNCNRIQEYSWAVLGGMWIPTGGAKRLGVHPELGMQGGYELSRFTVLGSMIVRFLDTPQPYLAWNPQLNYAEWTSYFLGYYFGLDFGYRLNEKGPNGVYALAGMGYDGFDTFSYYNDNDQNAPTVDSFNFNFGAGYRVVLKKGTFIGLQVKYNVVDYSHPHMVDFTGNTVSIDLIVGSVTQERKECRKQWQSEE